MAEFLSKSQVSVSAPKEDVAVKNLGADLTNLFGAVGKGAETYNVIGETAAKLEFQEQSIRASKRMTQLQVDLTNNPNNPAAVLAYKKGMDAITTELVAKRDDFKNHKAAYDEYNNLAVEFSASARAKYAPASAKMYLEENLNQIKRKGNTLASGLGKNALPAHISIYAQELVNAGAAKDDAVAESEKLHFSYNIKSTKDELNMLRSEDIQLAVTNEDGSPNLQGAVTLFNNATGSNLASVSLVDGKPELQVDTDNVEYREDYSAIFNRILGHWSEPTGDGENNYAYINLENTLGKATLEAQPLDFRNINDANAVKLNEVVNNPKLLATLTPSQTGNISQWQIENAEQRAKYDYLDRNGVSLLSPDSAFTDVIIQPNKAYDTVTGVVKKDLIISGADVSAYRKQRADNTAVVIKGGTAEEARAEIMAYSKRNNGEVPATVKREVSSSLNGYAPSNFTGVRINVKTLAASLDIPTYGTKDQVLAMRELSEYGAGLVARIESKDGLTEDKATALYADAVRETHSKLKSKRVVGDSERKKVVDELVSRYGTFDLKTSPATMDSVMIDMSKLDPNLTPEQKYDKVKELYTTTTPAMQRIIGKDSYLVKKQFVPKTKTLMTDDQMWNGIAGSINYYVDSYNQVNKKTGKKVRVSDFDYEIGSDTNGNTVIDIKHNGVTVKKSILDNVLLFNRSKYKPKIKIETRWGGFGN